MNDIIQLQHTRTFLQNAITGLTDEQLLHVPAGFRNNILWNVGHLVVTQQILHYKFSGLDMYVPDDLSDALRKGTSPAEWQTVPDIQQIKSLLIELPQRLMEDYNRGRFERYHPYTTSSGVPLNTIEDALRFNNWHEGLHTGTVLALKKLV